MLMPNYFKINQLLKKLGSEIFRYSKYLCCLILNNKLKKEWDDKSINENKNKDIVIIAGGPSFTKEIQDYLIFNRDKYQIMAVNYYYLNPVSDKLIPDFYVVSDSVSSLSINRSDINEKKYKYIHDHNVKLICPLGKDWDFFENPYLRFNDSECFLSRNIKPYLPRGYPSNTLFKAIASTIALNYRAIFIVGLDYNYPNKIFLDPKNKIMMRDEHHYEKKTQDISAYYESVAHALLWWSLDYHFFSILKRDNVFNVSDNTLIDFFKKIPVNEFLGCERNEIQEINKE